METSLAPRHVAVIMDGNGRWAEKRGLSRINGHIAGAENVPKVANILFSAGVEIVTLYAFSKENFARPQAEVEGIFQRVKAFALSFTERPQVNARVYFTGEEEGLPADLVAACRAAERATKSNGDKALNILLNYGGRSEILRAARLLCGEPVTEESFRSKLLFPDLPDPDLIIRTGGEKRLSGFMLFQSAYSELYFCDALFPDFGVREINSALADYRSRERRFGGIKTP